MGDGGGGGYEAQKIFPSLTSPPQSPGDIKDVNYVAQLAYLIIKVTNKMYVMCCYCPCLYKDLNRNENELNNCTTTTIIRIYVYTNIYTYSELLLFPLQNVWT